MGAFILFIFIARIISKHTKLIHHGYIASVISITKIILHKLTPAMVVLLRRKQLEDGGTYITRCVV